MKYKRKTSKVITSNFLRELLSDRGFPIYDQPKEILDPDRDNEYDPLLLDNMEKGAELLKHHIENSSKIYICVDADVDGYTSAALVYNFLNDYIMQVTICVRRLLKFMHLFFHVV